MNISSASASAVGLNYAQTQQLRAAAKQAADARKAEIATDKTKAMQSPAFEAAESKKRQAKAKIQQINDWLKIVRKLYAMDPKGMAKALAQVFKDLKAAVKAYRDAGGDEMSASGAAASAAMTPAASEKTEEKKADEVEGAPRVDGEAAAADASEPVAESTPTEEPTETAEKGAGLYQAVVDDIRKSVGEDGLDFIKTVRELTHRIVELLDTARGQAAIRKKDKATDKAFEDAGKELKGLREEIDGMEQDIRREAPMAGMKLSVAA